MKWEHQHVKHRNLDVFEDHCDEAGSEGWELIAVILNSTSEYVGFFKREKKE